MKTRSYAPEKPADCRLCHFWHNRRCTLGKENCYYLTSDGPAPKSECDGCPYGRDRPCIGWCTKKLMREAGIK